MTKSPSFALAIAGVVFAGGLTVTVVTMSAAQAGARDWPMVGGDMTRSSASTAPTNITAANVAALERQQVTIDGIVDASAIYLHGVQINGAAHNAFFVTTTYGKTLAIDADTGTTLWEYKPAGADGWAGTPQITNTTPLADPARTFIYTASPGGDVEKIAIANGQLAWSTPITKLPQREKIGSPLGYVRGRLIAVTDGYIGDRPPYQGHVAILDAAGGKLLQVWNSLCSDRHELLDPSSCPQTQSAIWGRAGAVVDPATGNIFIATGNGPWDGKTSWGDAVIELNPDATEMVGNYTPVNNEELNARDADVGSTSPVLLGGGYIAQGGKDGTIRVLSLQTIKGTDPHKGGESQIVSTPSGQRLLTAPAVWHSGGKTWMFAADGGGTTAWTFASGRLAEAWRSPNGGTSPFVAGGLLFVYDPAGALRVYDAASGRAITNLPCGSGHWNSPIVVDDMVILPEGNANNRRATEGVIDIWRVPKAVK